MLEKYTVLSLIINKVKVFQVWYLIFFYMSTAPSTGKHVSQIYLLAFT